MTRKNDEKRLTQRAESLIAEARAAGADAADAIVVQGRSLSISCRMGKREEIDQAEGDDAGLRVFVGRRQASVSTNRLDPREFPAIAERAVAMARQAPEDPYCGLADPTTLARDWRVPDMLDQTEIDADGLAAMALAAEAAGLAVAGITNSNGASASWTRGGMVLATSDGFSGAYTGSRFSLSCSLVAGHDTGMERDYDFASATHLANLTDAAKIGTSAGERTTRRLGGRKIESCRVPVIYESRAAASLVGHLLGAISGAAIARKTSFLKDALGQSVFRNGIEIVDDPLRPRGLASRPFDAEGVAVKPMALVSDGRIATWLLDSASARELGLVSTGHARRGVGGPPAPGASNVHLAPGTDTPQDLIAGIKRGLYITDLIGHGVNMVSGDYSRGVAGFWVENGRIEYPVSEITIAGNLRDMYKMLIPASDLEFRTSLNAPSVLIEEMTVAGR